MLLQLFCYHMIYRKHLRYTFDDKVLAGSESKKKDSVKVS